MLWKTDATLQEYVRIICEEGRLNDLVKACDSYHFERSFGQTFTHWLIDFHSFTNEHHRDIPVWRFNLPSIGAIYFIGQFNEVKQRIDEIL